MNRPIIGDASNPQPQTQPEQPVVPQVVTAPQKLPDSPLATHLPAWDLLPAHTLLVRRRPLKK